MFIKSTFSKFKSLYSSHSSQYDPYPSRFLTISTSSCTTRATAHKRSLQAVSAIELTQPSQSIMQPTLRSGYSVIEWRMFYLSHAWQKGLTASCNNPRFSSSVRWRNTVQIFSVSISDVWDYASLRFSVAISDCVTANGDKATFIELLVTTAPFVTGSISSWQA